MTANQAQGAGPATHSSEGLAMHEGNAPAGQKTNGSATSKQTSDGPSAQKTNNGPAQLTGDATAQHVTSNVPSSTTFEDETDDWVDDDGDVIFFMSTLQSPIYG